MSLDTQTTTTLSASSQPLLGTDGDDLLVGTDGDDQISGLGGNDTLDGVQGADTLIGGAGNDIYLVNSDDAVIEQAGQGEDLVKAAVSWALDDNCENLTLIGNASLGIGNALDNILIGNAAANTLQGEDGNDTLDGGEGVDRLLGGRGNDIYFVNGDYDEVLEDVGEGIDLVKSTVSWLLESNVENLTLLGNDAIDGIGNRLNNTLIGNAAANTLDGGEGIDRLEGGLGDDTYVVDVAEDTVVEAANAGTDLVKSSISWVLGDNLENLTLTGFSSLNATGNALNNKLTGNAGSNILDGGAGADTLVGGVGNDTYLVDNIGDTLIEDANGGTDLVKTNISWALGANLENLTLTGSANINATGNALNNELTGNDGANILDGAAGNDTLIGGKGNDTYLVNGDYDVVEEAANEGVDTVISSVSWLLEDNVENLTLTGSDNLDGIGNSLDNVLTGNAGANVLDGRGGADTLAGGAGDDTYLVDSTADVLIEAANAGTDLVKSSISWTLADNLENLTLLGTSSINATGNKGVNTLTGNDGDNVLDGGEGADMLAGGKGDDTYVVDNAADTVTEDAFAGTDLVKSSISWTLGANLENLTLTGTADLNATGNALANTLTGNAGANVLNGGEGQDTLIGGQGNDTYIIESGNDKVIEQANGGIDLVKTNQSWALDDNVENLTLTGSANINGFGNGLANTLIGNAANNILDGGAGADRLEGGAGDDTYIVDNIGDVVVETATAGNDTVSASVSWTLADHLENLVLTGNQALNGTGNARNNTLTGNAAANTLDGGAGADRLIGGAGDDVYVIDNAGDTATERANEGTDLVNSSITWALGENFENLTLVGTNAVSGAGNALNNTLTGNAASNTLDGGAGADRMFGGAGNDTYIVDNANDLVTEYANAGIDTVYASVSHTLTNNVENLILTGTGNIDATGNVLNNVLLGNSGNNALRGMASNDILQGGVGADNLKDTGGNNLLHGGIGDDVIVAGDGNDFLVGGLGNDTITTGRGRDVIAFKRGSNTDTLNPDGESNNTLSLGGGIKYADLSLKKSNNDLVLAAGSNDQVMFKDWYAKPTNRSVSVLQVVIDGTADYNAKSTSKINNKKVQQFDFGKLVTDFDAARAKNAKLTTWAVSGALLQRHLGGSDTTAIGGDLAYQFGRNGNFSQLSSDPVFALLGNAKFGVDSQAFSPTGPAKAGLSLI